MEGERGLKRETRKMKRRENWRSEGPTNKRPTGGILEMEGLGRKTSGRERRFKRLGKEKKGGEDRG